MNKTQLHLLVEITAAIAALRKAPYAPAGFGWSNEGSVWTYASPKFNQQDFVLLGEYLEQKGLDVSLSDTNIPAGPNPAGSYSLFERVAGFFNPNHYGYLKKITVMEKDR